MTHKNHDFGTLLKGTLIIPVMVVKNIDDAIPMAENLIEQGYKVLEVTLRTDCALEAIKLISDHFPAAIIGAGTVVNADHYNAAVKAGAKFIVGPGHTEELLEAADKSNIPFLPGAATPSEIMKLSERGYKYLKLFPAEAIGGIKLLKSIAGPFPDIKFCPTGGIDAKLADDYLELHNVICVGGSWMV